MTKAFVQPQEKASTSTVAIAGLIHLPQQFSHFKKIGIASGITSQIGFYFHRHLPG
jgi:hypothetical protein